MGAGIPLEIPGVLDDLSAHAPTSYPIYVQGAQPDDNYRTHFAPADFVEPETPSHSLTRPAFFPIISSATLANMLIRRATGSIEGLIVEGSRAGGHNAPPRGKMQFDDQGQPIYGPRDAVKIAQIREYNLPFWLAGSYGSPERMQEAIAHSIECDNTRDG